MSREIRVLKLEQLSDEELVVLQRDGYDVQEEVNRRARVSSVSTHINQSYVGQQSHRSSERT